MTNLSNPYRDDTRLLPGLDIPKRVDDLVRGPPFGFSLEVHQDPVSQHGRRDTDEM